MAIFWSFLFLNVSVFFFLVLLLFHHPGINQCFTAISWVSFKVSVEAYYWGCLWGYPVPTGSRPPCCPPPRESCGPESEGPAAGPSSQSRSSTPWPSLRHHAQTTRSCPRPAVEKPVRHVGFGVWAIQHSSWWLDHITNVKLGQQVCLEVVKADWESICVSPRVSWRSASAQGPIEVPPAAAGRVSKTKINVCFVSCNFS